MYQPQRKKVIASNISATQSRNITAQSGRKLAAISPAVKASIVLARFLFFSLLSVQTLVALIAVPSFAAKFLQFASHHILCKSRKIGSYLF